MGSKQEELETCASLQGYDLIGITETWWDGSYDWTVGMEGYRLFRTDRQGDKEEVSPSMSMTSWSAWRSAWGWMRSQPRTYESGLKGGQGQVTLQWGSATGHLTRKTEQMRPSIDR